jgi:N-acetylneuraminic acid mutarotase
MAFGYDKTPYIFGGYVEVDSSDNEQEQSKERYVVNDLWRWAEKKGWECVTTTGSTPTTRLVGATAVSDNRMFLLGGWNPQADSPENMFLDTVHCLDLDTMEWSLCDTVLPDGPSSRHVALTLPATKEILLHNHRCEDFVWLFDPVKKQFRKQPTSGPYPSSRGLHAATTVNETHVVLFGGAAQDQTMSNEAFLLNTVTWEWTLLDTSLTSSASAPSPRAAPCLCCLDQDTVLLFGGAERNDESGVLTPLSDVWALFLGKSQWKLLTNDVNGPPPRNAATLQEISTEPREGKRFLLTGGWHPFVQTWDDCYVLRVEKE